MTMGFLGKLFSSSSKEKNYDKYGDVLKKTMTTKDQRLEAIEALEDLEAAHAIPQLLKRFEMVVESGMQDQREKEQCMKIIVSHGDKAKDLVREAVKSKRRVAWPIKIAEKIFSPQEYIDLLLESLNLDMAMFDDDVLEHNEELLLALKEMRDPRIVERAALFIEGRDENLRMAALECLEEQASEFSDAKRIILNLAKTPHDDSSSRIVGVANAIVQKHNWV